jgi:hypothetical protein
MMSGDDNDYGETDILKGLLAGVAGGLLASFLMEQFQAAWSAVSAAMQDSGEKKERGAGKKSQPATVKAANVISKKITGRKVPKDYRPAAGEVVHYAMGATSAAVYGVLAEVAPMITTGDGIGFGMGVWMLADEVAVPAAGLSKPPQEIPLTTHVYALASHLVYGWITETVRRAVRRAL